MATPVNPRLLPNLSYNKPFKTFAGGLNLDKPLAQLGTQYQKADEYRGADIPAKLIDKDRRDKFLQSQNEMMGTLQGMNPYLQQSASKQMAGKIKQEISNPLTESGRTKLNYEKTVELDDIETKRTTEGKIDGHDKLVGKQLRESQYKFEGGAGYHLANGDFVPNEYKSSHIAPDKIDSNKIIKSYGEGFKDQVESYVDKDGKTQYKIKATSNPTNDGHIRTTFEKWSGVTGDRVKSYVAANLMYDNEWRSRTDWEGKKALFKQLSDNLGSLDAASDFMIENPQIVDEYLNGKVIEENGSKRRISGYAENQAFKQAGLEAIKQEKLDIDKSNKLTSDSRADLGFADKLKKSKLVVTSTGSTISLTNGKLKSVKDLTTSLSTTSEAVYSAQQALILAKKNGSQIDVDRAQSQLDFNKMKLSGLKDLEKQAKSAVGVTDAQIQEMEKTLPKIPENLKDRKDVLDMYARNSKSLNLTPKEMREHLAKIGAGAQGYVAEYKLALAKLSDAQVKQMDDMDKWMVEKANTAGVTPHFISVPNADVQNAVEDNFKANSNWVIMTNDGNLISNDNSSDGDELVNKIRTNGKITQITQNKIGSEHYYSVSMEDPDTKETTTYYAKPGTGNNIKDIWALGIIDNVFEGNSSAGVNVRNKQLTIASNMLTNKWDDEISTMQTDDVKEFFVNSSYFNKRGDNTSTRVKKGKSHNDAAKYTIVDKNDKPIQNEKGENVEFENKNDLDAFLTKRTNKILGIK